MSLGQNLRKLRSKTKYSQKDIADLLEIDRNTYANWESEKTEPSARHIPELANIFNVEIAVLFEEEINTVEDNLR